MINRFRTENAEGFKEAFTKVLVIAQEIGQLKKFGNINIDGTKIHADASKHAAVRYKRAVEMIGEIEKEVEQLVAKAAAADSKALEDGLSIPEELARREVLKAKLEYATQEMKTRYDEVQKAAEEQKKADAKEKEEKKKAKAEKKRTEKEQKKAEKAEKRAKKANKEEQSANNPSQETKTETVAVPDNNSSPETNPATSAATSDNNRSPGTVQQTAAVPDNNSSPETSPATSAATSDNNRSPGTVQQTAAVPDNNSSPETSLATSAAVSDNNRSPGTVQQTAAAPDNNPSLETKADTVALPEVDPKKPLDDYQYNFTDPESRIMITGTRKHFEQSYNAQAAVDTDTMLIVGKYVTNHGNDKRELCPIVQAANTEVYKVDGCTKISGVNHTISVYYRHTHRRGGNGNKNN